MEQYSALCFAAGHPKGGCLSPRHECPKRPRSYHMSAARSTAQTPALLKVSWLRNRSRPQAHGVQCLAAGQTEGAVAPAPDMNTPIDLAPRAASVEGVLSTPEGAESAFQLAPAVNADIAAPSASAAVGRWVHVSGLQLMRVSAICAPGCENNRVISSWPVVASASGKASEDAKLGAQA